MIWVFAVLIVALIGAVGVVAAGRGTPLQGVYDDRSDANLDTSDLRKVRFTTAFRGYRMAEVDALLLKLVNEREDLRTHLEARSEMTDSTGAGDDAGAASP